MKKPHFICHGHHKFLAKLRMRLSSYDELKLLLVGFAHVVQQLTGWGSTSCVKGLVRVGGEFGDLEDPSVSARHRGHRQRGNSDVH